MDDTEYYNKGALRNEANIGICWALFLNPEAKILYHARNIITSIKQKKLFVELKPFLYISILQVQRKAQKSFLELRSGWASRTK